MSEGEAKGRVGETASRRRGLVGRGSGTGADIRKVAGGL